MIAPWCNGSTPDFGSGNPSSNLGGATTTTSAKQFGFLIERWFQIVRNVSQK